jgi:peptidoglycan-N-acetylglucosamine deacetylase
MKFLTFDIEDYHHILDIPGIAHQFDPRYSIVETVTDSILKLLKKYDVLAVFFVLGEVADQHPELVKKIASNGHLLGTHSYAHQLHKDISDEEFENDLLRSIDAIERASGQRVFAYRAPGFSLQKQHFHRYEIIRKYGILYDFSLFQGKASHGGVDFSTSLQGSIVTSFGDIDLFPFVRSDCYGLKLPLFGGGYFRLCPQWLLDITIQRSGYVMTYFHPRDFSPSQPRLKGLSPIRYFKSYIGLGGSFKKLESIIKLSKWDGATNMKENLNG